MSSSEQKNEINWSFLIVSVISIATVSLGMKIWIKKSSTQTLPNYLYLGSKNLKKHAISKSSKTDNAIVFLGSSAVAGSNIPAKSSVAHYFQESEPKRSVFSLGVHQATIVDSLAYYLLALKYQKPKLVIMGVSPEYFPNHWPASRVISSNLELLNTTLSPSQIEKLKWANKKKLFFIEDMIKGDDIKIPPPALIVYKSFFERLRHSFFGPVMAANLVGKGVTLSNITPENPTLELLSVFKELVEENGGRLFVFLEPQLSVDKFYGEGQFDNYLSFIKKQLDSREIDYLDYVHLFPNDAEHYIDFIHLTPFAYEKLAKKMHQDLVERGQL